MLNGSTNRGLGGNESNINQSMTSSLLKSQYLSMVASMKQQSSTSTIKKEPKKKSKLPRYTLQSGYDKQISLPNSDESEDLSTKVVVPKHLDHLLPLKESILTSKNVRLMGDFALFQSRQFRVGFAPFWTLANPGDSLIKTKVKEASFDVFIEAQPALEINNQVIDSYESWLEVHLENCVLSFDFETIPKIEVCDGLNALHAHAEEAERQFEIIENLDTKDIKQVLDLMVALWGRLRPLNSSEDDDLMEEENLTSPENHKTTMERKELLTKWLEKVSGNSVKGDLEKAKNSSNHLGAVMALLSGNKRLEAAEISLDKSDHYLATLISMASGPNLTFGQLLQNQLELWQESRADKFIEEQRLKIYSLLSGKLLFAPSLFCD